MNSSATPAPGIRVMERSPDDVASVGHACGMYAVAPYVSREAMETYWADWVAFHTSIGELNADLITSRFKRLPDQNAIEVLVIFSTADAFRAWFTAPYMQPYRAAAMPLFDMERYAQNPPVIWGADEAVVTLFGEMKKHSGVSMRFL
jgi:hypothetical protein